MKPFFRAKRNYLMSDEGTEIYWTALEREERMANNSHYDLCYQYIYYTYCNKLSNGLAQP